MNESEWKTLLTEYNRELLSYEQVVEALPRELIKKGWLGYPGATEGEVTATEKRLATPLPPSYRAFLKTSNGWRFPSVSILALLPADKVTWFREQNQDWIDAYVGPAAELPSIPDKEYLVYGAKQDCVNFRTEYLLTALQISDVGDGADWWPVDHAQVAPLVLLTDERLETLMTPERCRLVLSTPRGPEGAKPEK